MNDACRCDRLDEAVPGDVSNLGYGRSFIAKKGGFLERAIKRMSFREELATDHPDELF
jgi:hypothetical protein